MDDLRKSRRLEVHGLNADISDGIGFFPGIISDISRQGLGLSDLPQRVDDSARKMTIVVTGHGRNFKMLVRPRWSEKEGIRKKIGCEIVTIPWEWTDFVSTFEPKDDEDIWNISHL